MAQKQGAEIKAGDTLIGDQGGRSYVYDVRPSNAVPGMLAVETEHGYLYLDPDDTAGYEVEVVPPLYPGLAVR